jgi:hypothetical protein
VSDEVKLLSPEDVAAIQKDVETWVTAGYVTVDRDGCEERWRPSRIAATLEHLTTENARLRGDLAKWRGELARAEREYHRRENEDRAAPDERR